MTSSPIILHTDRLNVEIAQPGSIYTGARFDWTGFITQVTLDGKHTFCTPESLEPGQGTGGIGLCNEFGIEMPIGYDDAKPGETFPKLGIGLLVRPDTGPYQFQLPYEIAQRFPLLVEKTHCSVSFTVEPLDCRGYAVQLKKTFLATNNQLWIEYQLKNVGQKPIVTHEYCHNFVSINHILLGPEYRLRMPYRIEFEKLGRTFAWFLPPVLRKVLPHVLQEQLVNFTVIRRRHQTLAVDGNELYCRDTPQKPFYCRLLGLHQTDQAQWELRHLPSNAGIREYDDFHPIRLAIWGTTHVISTEVFVDIHLPPGATQTWTRRYEFLA